MRALETIDRGSGTPIVWIHGFPLSSLIFEGQFEIPGVRHVAPDLPGFGRSAPEPVESIDRYAERVLALLDAKGIREAVIAGVSMGGYVAFSMLRQRPSLATGLVLIDTREVPDTSEGRRNRLAQIDRVEKEGTSFLIEAMLPRMLTSATIRAGDRRTEMVRHAMESATPAGVCAALRAMADRGDSTAALRSASCPVLVVVGTEDDLTPPSDAERMSGTAKNSTLVRIPGAAHLSNVERPDVFNGAVRSFLDRS